MADRYRIVTAKGWETFQKGINNHAEDGYVITKVERQYLTGTPYYWALMELEKPHDF